MSQTYTIGRVRFAEEDYQLLVGSSLIILAILIISYFALFVEPSPEAEATYVRSEEPKPLETINSVSSPKREVTPKKDLSEKEEEQTFSRNTSSNSKSPVPSHHSHEEEEEPEEEEHHEREEHSVVTPVRRGRGRKKQEKTSEDFGTLVSPEGRRTSLRLKKRRDDSQ